MKDLVIIGAGAFAREIAWLIEDINKKHPTYRILGFLDDDEKKQGLFINGYKCLGAIAKLMDLNKDNSIYALIAMQNGDIRRRIVEMFPEFKNWETVVHPSANISDTSKIGKGCIICSGNSISVNIVIGDHCVFNRVGVIGHDCIVGNYVSVMSGAVICGRVTIKDNAYLATNCSVMPNMVIGSHAIVGAGSVVLRNVKDNTTVMGVPAKRIKFV